MNLYLGVHILRCLRKQNEVSATRKERPVVLWKVLEQASLPLGPCQAQLQPELTVILLTRYTSFNHFPGRSRYGDLLTKISTASKFPLYPQLIRSVPSSGKGPFLRAGSNVTSLPESYWILKEHLVIPLVHSQRPLLQRLKGLYHYPCTCVKPPLDCETLHRLCILSH